MLPRVTLRQALADTSLLGSILAGGSWKLWRVLLIAAMGEELDDDERVIFQQLTQRDREPGQRVEELVAVVGRRGGKSRAISTLAAYIGGLCSHPALVAGERGVLLIIAPDTKQATICLDYITAAFEGSPILQQLVEGRTQWALRLNNRVDIEVRASDFRRLRGPTFVCCIADESAFWFEGDAANPDTEILTSIRPGLATTGGPLIMISSPYAKRGELFKTFQKHFGANGDPAILVAQGSSRQFNSTLRQSVIDRAMERDPASASAEYLAQFRIDVELFVSIEVARSCTIGLLERAPQHGITYKAFTDPSGGSSDSFTLAIGHEDHARQTVVVDCLREAKPPFSPEQIVAEFSRVLNSYRIGKVIADRYGGAWVTEQFSRFNIYCEQSAKVKSDLYIDLLALLNSRRIELPDHPKLVNQLVGLERRTARGGKDSVDHAPGQHDDLANSVAGLASLCLTERTFNYAAFNSGDTSDSDTDEEWRRWRRNVFLESHGLIRV